MNAELGRGEGCGGWLADWKSAIQQIGNLRYRTLREIWEREEKMK